MAMKWADLEEEKFSGCEHGSFESRFWTLSNLCFAKKEQISYGSGVSWFRL